jgi:hypothetical protein
MLIKTFFLIKKLPELCSGAFCQKSPACTTGLLAVFLTPELMVERYACAIHGQLDDA